MLTPYKLKGRLQHRDAVRLPLMTDFIVVRQPQAPMSCISFEFYRCLPTLRSIHPDSLSDLRCQPHQQDVACFPIYSIFDIWFLINQF